MYIYISICLSVYLSIYLSVYIVSVCMSIGVYLSGPLFNSGGYKAIYAVSISLLIVGNKLSSHGIEPKRDRTHFLKIKFVVAGGWFYYYYKLQCIELDKERKNARSKNKFSAYRKIKHILKNWFNPVLGSIPRVPKKLC